MCQEGKEDVCLIHETGQVLKLVPKIHNFYGIKRDIKPKDKRRSVQREYDDPSLGWRKRIEDKLDAPLL